VDDVGTVAYSVSSDVVIWQSIGVISTRGRRATGGNHRVAGQFHGWNRGGENHKVSTAQRPCVVEQLNGGSRSSRHWARLPETVRLRAIACC